MKAKYSFLIFIVLVFVFIVYSSQTRARTFTHTEANLLGTLITFQLYAVDDSFRDIEINRLVNRIKKLENVFSTTRKESLLSKLNEARELDIDSPESRMLAEVLRKALQVKQDSSGAFNPFLDNLIKKWGFYSSGGVLEKSVIDAELDRIRNTGVTFDGDRIRLTGEATINLGGIAKGFIVDEVVKECRAMKSLRGGIIDAGGDVVVFGQKINGKPFSVGIRRPSAEGGILAVLSLDSDEYGAVATSGDYERVFTVDGKKYHHLIDPATGYPKEVEFHSVTILSSNLLLSDALATAVIVGGRKVIPDLVKKYRFEYVLVQTDGELLHSEKAGKMLMK